MNDKLMMVIGIDILGAASGDHCAAALSATEWNASASRLPFAASRPCPGRE